MRETITTNRDGEAMYALLYEPSAALARLKLDPGAAAAIKLTPRLAAELIEDLGVFIEQAKKKPRVKAARPKPDGEGIRLKPEGA